MCVECLGVLHKRKQGGRQNPEGKGCGKECNALQRRQRLESVHLLKLWTSWTELGWAELSWAGLGLSLVWISCRTLTWELWESYIVFRSLQIHVPPAPEAAVWPKPSSETRCLENKHRQHEPGRVNRVRKPGQAVGPLWGLGWEDQVWRFQGLQSECKASTGNLRRSCLRVKSETKAKDEAETVILISNATQ